MAKIGSLTADLKLESAAFIRDMRKASQETALATSQMSKSMASVQTGLAAAGSAAKGFIAGFVTVQAVRSMVTLGKAAIDTADDIGAAAAAVGVGAEELQRLRFAAEQTDVSIASMDAALKLFQKSVATGKIENQSFQDFIQRIREAPTQIEKVRIAQEGLGKQFQTGLLLASQTGEAFRRYYEGAFVISEKAIQAASDLDNQLRELQAAVGTGFATGFIETFAGAVDTSEEQLRAAHEAAKDFGTIIATVMSAATKTVTSLSGAVASLNEELKSSPTMLGRDFGQWIRGQLGFSTGGGESSHAKTPAASATGGDGLSGGASMASAADVKRMTEYADTLRRTSEQTNQLIAATRNGSLSYQDLNDKIEATNDALKAGYTATSAQGQAMIALGVANRQAERELAAHVEQMRLIPDLVRDMGGAIAATFADAIVEGEKFGDVLDSLAKDLTKMALNTFFQAIITGALTGGAGGTGGLLSGLFHGGGIVGRTGVQKRSVSPSLFAHAPRLHDGLKAGEFPAILEQGEKVTPAGANDNVTVNVYAPPGSQVKTRESQDSSGRNIDVLIDQFDTSIGQRIIEGRSKIGGAVESAYGARRVAR